MSDDSKGIAELMLEEKRALIAQLLSSKTWKPRSFPLSFAQERLWFLDQLAPGNAFYNIPMAVRLTGWLDIIALERSFNEIIGRHEMLRTTFSALDGRLVQTISSASLINLPVMDLSTLSETEQTAETERLANEEAQRPFDLAHGPVIRITLLRLGDNEHVVLVTMHHIVSDVWSIEVFAREVSTLYEAFAAGEPSPLPELSLQYVDYAVWQRQWLQGDVLEGHKAYWKRQLDGAPSMMDLCTDKPRPPFQSFRGATHSFRIPPRIAEALGDLSQQEEATLFMTLLAAFDVLLHRYSGQEDIVVGTPIAGRNRKETEQLIGFFVNTLVLRSNLSGNPTFRELLRRVREVAIGAYSHQELPFEKLVEELHPERNLSHNPLFQVMFVLQNVTRETREISGLQMSNVGVQRDSAKFSLVLSVVAMGDTLAGLFSYNNDLFNSSSIEWMAIHFQTLLESIAADPEQRISLLPLVTREEQELMLGQWNETWRKRDVSRCVHHLIARQAERTPEAVAVVFEDREISYGELEERSNRLGRYLKRRGAGPEELVGICMERGIEMMVAVLAVLKSGSGYLPLDPSYPEERLGYMISDSGVKLVVTESSVRKAVNGAGVEVVSIDELEEEIAAERGEELEGGAEPENVAYVIYTSGSTGFPKGVVIQHLTLAERVQTMTEMFGLGPDDRQLQFVSLNFDVACEEIFPTLSVGARLVLCREPARQTASDLMRECARTGVTKLNMPASFWHQAVDEMFASGTAAPDSLRVFVTGGESPSYDKLRKWKELTNSRSRFFNVYGPTEATILVTAYELAADFDLGEERARIPIGRPLANAKIYLLDSQLGPVPVGVPGELYIGGGLARGYLHRPDLTAEKFIPDPFNANGGARLYRTGDLARWLPDGNIEFIGRVDSQIKIRGFRVELGEIEAALKHHQAVLDAVVRLREDVPGDKRLVAYLVLEPGRSLNVTELRSFSKERLPDYMVPAAFVVIDAIPLTANQKIDWRALPAPDSSRPQIEEAYVAPQTELEHLLVRMWTETLGISRVGIHDNFFELGGDSIRGALFINKLQDKLGQYVYVVALFDAPTVGALATFLREHYARAVKQLCKSEPVGLLESGDPSLQSTRMVDSARLAEVRDLIEPLPPRGVDAPALASKNPPAIFVLSPPRSGSTLLRVMLAGHPHLFVPPELDLLSFNTLKDRTTAFSGRYAFWLEGTIRALMEINGCDARAAQEIMLECEARDMKTQQFYRLMQERIEGRILVDKTPSYSLDLEILKRAEQDFDNAIYIHLVRHPYGMIRSFEEARTEQLFFRYEHTFATRELGELIWDVAHQNIGIFLDSIPAHRKHMIKYEDLVGEPRAMMESLCDFLDLDFQAEMIEPYKNKERKMTDGIHPLSKMLGDVKFHEHKRIDASTAFRWKEHYEEDFLGDITWRLAEEFGYEGLLKARQSNAIEESSATHQIARLTRVGRDREMPLSFAQQRLWFLDQLMPGNSANNLPSAIRMTGDLNVRALEGSFNQLRKRHESLRTSFPSVDGRPVQQIADATAEAMPIVDLSELGEEVREAEAVRLAAEEAQRPFDLGRGPLMRVGLVKLSENEHVALFTMHHIISDGWSMGVLVTEVATGYEGRVEGNEEEEREELEVQYADYAVWQREWLQGEALERQLGYWRETLAGSPQVLELPTDRPRPLMKSIRGGRETRVLRTEVAERLRQLSQERGATLFMSLLAAFKVMLMRYSGQKDIVVGTPIAGRTKRELEGLIGFFVNTLVLRTSLEGDPSFVELLESVRKTARGAYANQDLPFEKIVEELQPGRSLIYAPVFQVMFAYNNVPMNGLVLPGLKLSGLPVENEITKFDLTLAIQESNGGLTATINYSTDLYEARTMRRMLEQYETLLESIVGDPEQRISLLRLVTREEQELMLGEWNETRREHDLSKCVHHLIARQAEATPGELAVVYEDREISYGELEERSNRLGRYLKKRGAGPEELIGICMERGIEMVAAVLGVLKSGAGYVPLDPSYPEERLEYMVSDSGVKLVVTEKNVRGVVAGAGVEVVSIDDDEDEIAAERGEELEGGAEPENVAYVIYTSGSTGTPKGVAVTHRNLSNYAQTQIEMFGVEAKMKVLQFMTLSFDVSMSEICLGLMTGSTLYVAPREATLGGTALIELLKEQAINIATMPPSVMTGLGEAELPELRTVITGGEAAPKETLRRWARGRRLFNAYGPTEGTICATVWEFDESRERVTIGRPIDNTEVYVLDGQMELAPIGVTGELYIGGEGVARGYHNRAELTAEKFVPNPYSKEAGRRLYRTGDLARRLANGEIEFVGRRDQQIKIRGHRVELGEIEKALNEHEGIEEAVVLMREDRAGDKRLVAYVVAAEGEERGIGSELREYLMKRLPDYMVPSVFVPLEQMPLSPNGKIDRADLPEPGLDRSGLQQAYAGPRTPIEDVVTGIWSEVLGIGEVGIHDNFFELGGHSLLATQVMSRVRKAMGIDVPLRRLFESVTPAELAESIEKEMKEGEGLLAPPITRLNRDRELPLSFAQQRLWFLDQLMPGNSANNLPSAIRMTGDLNVRALEGSFNQLRKRHESLRTSFPAVDGRPVQQIADATAEAMPIVDLSELGEKEREAEAVRLAAEEAQRPFDLGRGPLMRVGLVKLSENEHVALFTMHHIISDGWSMGVLVTEVATGYEGRVEGNEEEEREELEVQYADYAVWQREWLQGEALERQLGYWRETLAGSPQVLELPTDRPRPLMKSIRGGRETRVLRTEVAERLRQLSQERGATLFMSLLAAFKVMLMRYSGQKDIVVGTPIAGRTKRELEGLIGFFVNTLVLRTSLEGDPSFVELLESVREVAIGAYTHQDLPFEKLVEELQPQRDLGRDPLLQVLFVLQNIAAEGLKLPGLQLRGMAAESNTAKYDLTLMIQESNGGLTATINYSTDLYEAKTMRRMLEQYETLLESIVGDPEQRISLLRLVTREEQELMLGEWNETRREHDLSKCVHHLIARQAEATPGELAVVYEDREISYGELEERSNRLGRYLKKRGAGPEELIGICMERGIEMVVAVLGVLKSGAGYVPLDPSYPEERLEYMVSDSGVKLVVTEKNVRGVVAGAGVEVVSIDDDEDEIAAERGEELEGGAEPENVAYVIYTSGSTGTPKGVTVTHRNLSNYAQTQIEMFGVEAKMKVLQIITLSFDVSMLEICLGLMTGSTLYVAPREAMLGGAALIKLLEKERINVATILPSVMTGLGEAELPELRTVITGGEVAPKETLRRWARGRRLFNAYGPTEGTICATVWEFDESRERVTIGRPIDNTEVYVLDGQMELAPIGVTGELYIGGEGVARGYHNRAELTAEKFVPNPYSKDEGRRLYRTGDLARRLANGEVEFVGRRDQQIKIRGHRVELGEIEKALNEHEGIEEAVVLMREDRAGDKRLVAYVVAAEGEERGIGSELREYLMKRLPDYMVPSVFVPLEQMPLSPIGKLDRKALRRPEDFDSGLEPTHVAPRTDIEKAIAVIWREALQVQRVGIHDNFFDLGGHSLVLVQVHSKLQSAFGQELSVLQLFKYPTVASLASYMAETPTVVSSDPQPDDLGYKLKAGKSRLKQRTRLLNEGRGASNG